MTNYLTPLKIPTRGEVMINAHFLEEEEEEEEKCADEYYPDLYVDDK